MTQPAPNQAPRLLEADEPPTDLARQALALLTQLCLDQAKPLDLRIEASGALATLTFRPVGMGAPASQATQRSWLDFSEEEQAIMDAVGANTLQGKEIGRALGCPNIRASTRLRLLLANLVDRNALERSTDGYRRPGFATPTTDGTHG